MMLLLGRHTAKQLVDTTSALLARVQRLEEEQGELRGRLEGERQLRILTANLLAAAQTAPTIGVAIECIAQAMRAPVPRGRAGGLARARRAWRYLDGTFMPESEKEAAYLEDYERYARRARKGSDGAPKRRRHVRERHSRLKLQGSSLL
jgi:hypothetical protein